MLSRLAIEVPASVVESASMEPGFEIHRLVVPAPRDQWNHETEARTVTWRGNGRLRPSTYLPGELVRGEQLAEVVRWDLFLPAGTDIKASDHVVYQGITYNVRAVLDPRSMEVARRCLAETPK